MPAKGWRKPTPVTKEGPQIQSRFRRHHEDYTGRRFGKLTALVPGIQIQSSSSWLCRCDCGNHKYIASRSLRAGATQSCGCEMMMRNHPSDDMIEYAEREYRKWKAAQKT